MKKIGVLLAAALGFGATAQAAPVKVVETQSITIPVKDTQKKKLIKQSREIVPDGFGGIENNLFSVGVPPKMYGQYLQANRKQKWSK